MNEKSIFGRFDPSLQTMHGKELKYKQEEFDKNWVALLGFTGSNDLHALYLVFGTSALHLAVKLADVKPGDTVLCSDMTFFAG